MSHKHTILILLFILMSPIQAHAGLTRTQVSELYVTIFGRASEGEGNTYWQSQPDMATAAAAMLETPAVMEYFGTSLDSDQAFIEHIYRNTLNKTISQDTEGIRYWTAQLGKGVSRGQVVASLIDAVRYYAPGSPYYNDGDGEGGGREGGGGQPSSEHQATLAAYHRFQNRVTVSNYMADTVWPPPSDWVTSTAFSADGLNVTDNAATVTNAKSAVNRLKDRIPDIELNLTAVSLEAGESTTVTISGGVGTYSVVNTNTQVASASVSGNRLEINGLSEGTITLVVTDDGDRSADVTVTVTLPPLTLSRASLTLDAGDSQNVTISGGAGDYTVRSNNNQTVITELQGSLVIITGLVPGNASITISDSSDNSAFISVNVTSFNPPPDNCGAYIAPGVWKEFDCYNLAAIGKTTNDDPFIPSWRLIGGYWQWGHKGPSSSHWFDTNTPNYAHGPTGSDMNGVNYQAVNEWDQTDAPDSAWSDKFITSDNPCPAGFTIPSRSQWEGVVNNNTNMIQGTWTIDVINFTSARFFGEWLMLPAAGPRDYLTGILSYRGNYGSYWSSTASTDRYSWNLNFSDSIAETRRSYRRNGLSVRCISE